MRRFVVILGVVLLVTGGAVAAAFAPVATCHPASAHGFASVCGLFGFLLGAALAAIGGMPAAVVYYSRTRDEITEQVLAKLPRGRSGDP